MLVARLSIYLCLYLRLYLYLYLHLYLNIYNLHLLIYMYIHPSLSLSLSFARLPVHLRNLAASGTLRATFVAVITPRHGPHDSYLASSSS